MRVGNDAAHRVLGFHHLEGEGERGAQNPSNSLSELLIMTLLLLHLILHKELLAAVRPSWHYTSQHNLRATCCLPTLSEHLLTLLPWEEKFQSLPPAQWMESSGEQDTASPRQDNDGELKGTIQAHEGEIGTRQPWKVLNAK